MTDLNEQRKKINTLYKWINESGNIVFFGGAGVSTESGIPDFRSSKGLYSEIPEVMLSHTYFTEHTAEFYKFYKSKMLYDSSEIKPNKAHVILAQLEKSRKLKAVVTQNIDGLHQAAGSVNVLELHGSIHRNYCQKCGGSYSLEYIKTSPAPVPKCGCGGIIKPDVVLYEEPLNKETLAAAAEYIRNADMLIAGGTSLAVQPAGSLIFYYEKEKFVLINMSGTPYDGEADLVIHGKIGEILGGYAAV